MEELHSVFLQKPKMFADQDVQRRLCYTQVEQIDIDLNASFPPSSFLFKSAAGESLQGCKKVCKWKEIVEGR